MKKASGFKMKNPSIAKLAKAAGSPMKQNPTYKAAFDAMTPTKSGTRVDKFGNVYKNNAEGLANFTKAAKAYNAKKNAPKVDNKKVDNKKVNNNKVDDNSKETTTTKTKKKFKDTRLGKFLTTKRVKGAKKKTYNPRLNRFE